MTTSMNTLRILSALFVIMAASFAAPLTTAHAATIIVGNDLTGTPTDGNDGPGYTVVDGHHASTLPTTSNFVIPSAGVLTAMTILNDTDTDAESVDLLVLRETAVNTYTVIQRVPVTDDTPSATTGTTVYPLASLAVLAGDILAHAGDTAGPIPLSVVSTGPGDVELFFHTTGVGGTLNFTPFPQSRDYFYNVTLVTEDITTAPEPNTFMLAALGLLGLVVGRRRRNRG